MKCLSNDEFLRWISRKNIRADGNRNLWFPGQQEKIMATLPKSVSRLHYLAARLNEWMGEMGDDSGRMVWLSSWTTDPSDQLALLEMLRFALGEERKIFDAPAHLFERATGHERAFMTGLIFFIMAFNWEGYILNERQNDFIFLGDEHIVFSSGDDPKMREVANVLASFDLTVIKNVREAWT